MIYSSSPGNNSVDYYLKGTGPHNPVAGSLAGNLSTPQGIGVDQQRNVYVANAEGQNVLVYANGSTSPTGTLEDPDKFPIDVAVGSDGTVYVANGSGPMFGSGNVVVYPRGASEPTQTLNNKHFLHVAGVALDKGGNLFVSYNAALGSGAGGVVEFKAPAFTHTVNMRITLENAAGVGFDRAGHLLVIDQNIPSLNVYNVGRRTPVATLPLPGASWFFAFNQDSSRLYVADYALGEIDVFRYRPTALKQTNKITNGITASNTNFGVADTPVQRL
ncbi:MAG TPA: hypothetical protein VGF86_14370 [Candidatus Tumulicola sp.]